MKKQNGITLIALIITIVVMLILVAVTLMIALGENGVITTTKNTKKEHEAAAFKEHVEIVAAGHYEPNYDWKSGVNVSGKYDWIAIQDEIKQEYPETNFTFNLSSLPLGAINAKAENMVIIEAEIYCCRAVIDYIDSKNLSGKITTTQKNGIQNVLDNAKQEFVEMEHERNPESTLAVADITTKLGTSMYAGTLKAGMMISETLYGPMSSMIAEYNGTAVPIGFINTNLYDYYVIMELEKAKNLFEFTDIVEEDGMRRTTIKSYKGNSKNVKVPGTLIDSNGDAIAVIGIEDYAFVNTNIKVGVINLLAGMDIDDTNYDEFLYNETATLGEFKALLDAPEDIYYCQHTDIGDACTSKLCKNEILKIAIIMMAQEEGLDVTEDNVDNYLALDSEKTLYVHLKLDIETEMMTPITPEECEESKVQNVLVSEGIQTIGNSFMNCTKLKEIYLPESIETSGEGIYYSHFSIGEDTFSGCTSLTTIKTMDEKIANFSRNWGCPNDITKIYIEPVLENN